MLGTIPIYGLPQDEAAFKLVADRSEVWIGNTIQMNLIVTNTDATSNLLISSVIPSFPEGWSTLNKSENVLQSPIEISPNSSKLIHFPLTVPPTTSDGSKTPDGNYTLLARISSERDNHAYDDVVSADLAVKRPPFSVLREIDWNAIWVLFLVLTIPGVAIERVVEALKWATRIRANSNWNLVKIDAEMQAYKSDIDKEKNAEKEPVKESVVIARKVTSNLDGLSESGKRILNLQKHLSEREIRVKFYTYTLSLIFGIVASTILVYGFNLGMLQLLGYTGDFAKMSDVFVSAIIMAFVTKPTHDVVELIEKIRNVKVGGL